MNTSLEIAKILDHTLLHPTAGSNELKKQCEIAKNYNVAALCVKPYMVPETKKLLKHSEVKVCCVIGFPSGNSSITSKVYETKDVCMNGAQEVDMVVNVGKVLDEDWKYVEEEIRSVTENCHDFGALVKVIIETDYIEEKHIIKLCEICTKVKADYVKTSTGFGYKKNEEGQLYYTGATVEHITLMKKSIGNGVKIKASGGIRDLDKLIKLKEAGADRIGLTATVAVMEEAINRFGKL